MRKRHCIGETLTGIKSQRCASAVPGADLPENKYLKNGKRYLNHDLELQVVMYEEAGRTKSFRNSTTIEYVRCDLCGKKDGLINWKINQHRMGHLKIVSY